MLESCHSSMHLSAMYVLNGSYIRQKMRNLFLPILVTAVAVGPNTKAKTNCYKQNQQPIILDCSSYIFCNIWSPTVLDISYNADNLRIFLRLCIACTNYLKCRMNHIKDVLVEQSRHEKFITSNLVDSASSHTLVSKIKPCMSKCKYSTLKLRMAHYISYSLFDSPLLLGYL